MGSMERLPESEVDASSRWFTYVQSCTSRGISVVKWLSPRCVFMGSNQGRDILFKCASSGTSWERRLSYGVCVLRLRSTWSLSLCWVRPSRYGETKYKKSILSLLITFKTCIIAFLSQYLLGDCYCEFYIVGVAQ